MTRAVLDLDAIRARLPHRADLEHNYDVVVPHAVEFGPTLRTLREFSYGGTRGPGQNCGR